MLILLKIVVSLSQSKLLDTSAHECICFSAQDLVFYLFNLVNTSECEKAQSIYYAENAGESKMVWQVWL